MKCVVDPVGCELRNLVSTQIEVAVLRMLPASQLAHKAARKSK